MHVATKAKERAARFRPAVLGTVLLLFGAAWTWLIQGGASPGAINSPALQALCGDWAEGAAAGALLLCARDVQFARTLQQNSLVCTWQCMEQVNFEWH